LFHVGVASMDVKSLDDSGYHHQWASG